VSLVAGVIFIGAVGLADCSESPQAGDPDEISVKHVISISCEEPGTGITFSPLGLDFGLLGELYVIDSDNSRVFILPDSLKGMAVFADCPEQFSDCQLIDVETDQTARIYVSERTSGLVLAFDRWGNFLCEAEIGEGLTGLSPGNLDQIYAAMSITGTVRIADLSGDSEPIECVISSDDGATYPVDCLAGKLGSVFVTEAFSGQVLILSPLGNPRGSLAGFEFTSPFGLTSYLDKYVLVSDSERAVIAVFSHAGDFVRSFGQGILSMPTFIDCRDDGTVCVADPGNMTIEVFRIESSAE
jgi:hypothetical protein